MMSFKEVELAARLFHSSDLDELMECLSEHPAQNKTQQDDRPSPMEAKTRQCEAAAPDSTNTHNPRIENINGG